MALEDAIAVSSLTSMSNTRLYKIITRNAQHIDAGTYSFKNRAQIENSITSMNWQGKNTQYPWFFVVSHKSSYGTGDVDFKSCTPLLLNSKMKEVMNVFQCSDRIMRFAGGWRCSGNLSLHVVWYPGSMLRWTCAFAFSSLLHYLLEADFLYSISRLSIWLSKFLVFGMDLKSIFGIAFSLPISLQSSLKTSWTNSQAIACKSFRISVSVCI